MLEALLRHLCLFRDGSAQEEKDYERLILVSYADILYHSM